jgi:hypothetical protein
VSPSSGSRSGGTVVTVFGANFVDSDSLACRFGASRVVSAAFVSPSRLECAAPSWHSSAAVTVEVSMNGVDFTAEGVVFQYFSQPEVASFSPSAGGVDGGTAVVLFGSNFTSSALLSCRFGWTVVPASFIAADTVICVAPAAATAGAVPVAVTLNGVDFYETGDLSFTYTSVVVVTSVVPAVGSVLGGTDVLVLGEGFPSDGGLSCRFGASSDVVASVAVNSSAVVCQTPPHSAGVVVLSLEWHAPAFRPAASAVFEFVFAPRLSKVAPSTGSSAGGTAVLVSGVGFSAAHGAIWCRFDELVVVAAEYVSAVAVTCRTPAHDLGAVGVEVSVDGVEWSNAVVYTYTGFINVGELSPVSGPARGGTPVVVRGSGFLAVPTLVCRFGVVVVPGTLLNSTAVSCLSPEFSAALADSQESRAVAVEVSNNGLDFGAVDALTFVYDLDAAVESVSPSVGALVGGTVVTVLGSDFMPGSPLSCVFGGRVSVPATVLNATAARCVSPSVVDVLGDSLDGGAVAVQVTSNGVDLSTSGALFTYSPLPSLSSIRPALGSAAGGTLVTIFGGDFPNVPELACRFGPAVVVPARWLSATSLSCVTPSWEGMGDVAVSVTVSRQEFVEDGVLQFFMLPPMRIEGISPSAGPTSGGTLVSVVGTSFVAAPQLQCWFGSLAAPAMFVSATQIVCASPAVSDRLALSLVPLTVSVNGVDMSASSAQFGYFAPPTVSAVAPTVGSTSGGTRVSVNATFEAPDGVGALVVLCKMGDAVAPAVSAEFAGTSLQAVCVTPVAPALHTVTWVSVSLAVTVEPVDDAARDVSVPFFPCNDVRFRYAPDPVLESAEPPSGVDVGGTVVTLRGFGFISTPTLVCRFAFGDRFDASYWESVVPAVHLSSTTVTCRSPTAAPGVSYLSVSNNGQEYTLQPLAFRVRAFADTVAMEPTRGIVGASTVLSMFGANFVPTPHLACRFVVDDAAAAGTAASIVVAGRVVSSNHVRCMSPVVNATSTWKVDLTLNGADYFPAFSFAFVAAPVVTDVRPVSGPVAGGTVLTVVGSGLLLGAAVPEGAAACLVGTVVVPARVVSDTELECTTPAYTSAHQDGEVVEVHVSVDNLQHFTPTFAYFTFTFLPRVTSLSPAMGAVTGGSVITVTGSDFRANTKLRCRFGDVTTEATWLSASQVSCVAPESTVGVAGVSVEVSNDGALHFSDDGVQFQYLAPMRLDAVVPSAGPVTGGTVVTVRGHNFVSSRQLACSFGVSDTQRPLVVRAVFVNASAVVCVTPAVAAVASVEVALTFSGVEWLHAQPAATFAFVPVAGASSLAPTLGPASGGTVITVRGVGFVAGQTRCRLTGTDAFGVAANVTASGDELVCATPPRTPGFASLELSVNDGRDWTSTALVNAFLFTPPLRILHVSPSVVAVLASESQYVVLRVANALATDALQARFSSPLVTSSSVVACERLNVSSVRCPVPVLSPGDNSVALSQNGVDFEGAAVVVGVRVPQVERCVPCSAVSRSPGSTAPAAPVDVYGIGFVPSSQLACRFGDVVSPATYVSPNRVRCAVPAHALGTVPLDVTWNGFDSTTAGLQFSFVALPSVSSVQPVSGSVLGGTLLLVRGSNFFGGGAAAAAAVACSFGESLPSTAATVLSDTELQCLSPPSLATGVVPLRVALKGDDLSLTAVGFWFVPPAHVTSLYPLSGPEDGTTLVTVSGTGFADVDDLLCVFDGVVSVAARWVSSTAVECMAPPHAPGTVMVEVSINGGADVTADRTPFVYVPVASAVSLSPTLGPVDGSTVVTIVGRNFVFTPALSCRFGLEDVPASFVSSTAVRCLSPPGGTAGTVDVSVTLNGVDSFGESLTFTYAWDATVTAVQPARGPSVGGTLVTLTGSNFVAGMTLCRFGGEPAVGVPAVSVSAGGTTALCVAPAHPPGSASVELSTNGGANWAHTGGVYLFEPSMAVESLSPTYGSDAGGFVVTLRARFATAFPNVPSLSCVFTSDADGLPTTTGNGSVSVQATWLSAGAVSCVAPPQPRGRSTVEVTANGVDATADGRFVNFHGPAEALSLSPLSGPVRGGTPVVIVGRNFVFEQTLRCAFGLATSTAVFVNDSAIVCLSPVALGGVGTVSVTVLNAPEDVAASVTPLEFTYTPTAVVTSVSPNNCPVQGGVSIVVRGSGFLVMPVPLVDAVLCRFGSDVHQPLVAATVVSTTEVRCIAPARSVGVHVVEVSTNGGVDFSTSRVNLTYVLPTRVFDLSPVLGPETGGTEVAVYGAFFVASSALVCRFGRGGLAPGERPAAARFDGLLPLVRAEWVSDREVRCVSPPASFGAVTVEVSNNGFDFSRDGILFTYHVPVQLRSLEPSVGPIAGGTPVRVFGLHFLQTAFIVCRFDRLTVPALFVNSSLVQCTAPTHPLGTAKVDVALNGVDGVVPSTTPLLDFSYVSEHFVSSLTPRKGPVSGGTRVLIATSIATATPYLACWFGRQPGTRVPAEFVRPGLLACVTPPSPILDGDMGPGGTVSVEVSVNGDDWSASRRQFEYQLDASVSTLSLSHLPEGEGHLLTVFGVNFVNGAELACRFVHSPLAVDLLDGTPATSYAVGRFISAEEVQCVLPAYTIGRVVVEVTNNGQQYTSDGAYVDVVRRLELYTMAPTSGPSWGSTVVSLGVAHLPALPGRLRMLCRFNGTTTPAAVSTPGVVTCVTPGIGVHMALARSRALDRVSVEVSTNGGAHFTSSGLVFTYFEPPTMQAGFVQPRLGSIFGGTRITVAAAEGTSFLAATMPRCRFGNVNDTDYSVVTATVSADGATMACTTPRRPAGITKVTVALNGVDFSRSGARFEFVNPPRVTSLIPLSGWEMGGTQLTLSGINFVATATLTCRFTTSYPRPMHPLGEPPQLPVVVDVTALWVSSTQLHCVTPRALPGVVTVEVAVNGADFTSDRVQFTYLPRPVLSRLTPTAGPLTGLIPVSVYGTRFLPGVTTVCRFGVYDAPAAYVSPVEIRCVAPPQPAGIVAVEVTYGAGGQEVTSFGLTFEYRPQAIVHYVYPNSGPATGGTLVTVVGERFIADEAGYCHWGIGNRTTPAVVVNATVLVCVSAPLPSEMLVESNTAGEVRVNVEVGSAGNVLTTSAIPFRYLTPCAVVAVNPAFGPSTGGTLVTVTGYNFVSSTRLLCRFGAYAPVPALWLSSTSLQCVSPAVDPWMPMALEVTNNGQDYTRDGVQFEFQKLVQLRFLFPTAGSIAGGTRVWLVGRDFVDSALLRVRFGTLSVRAMFVNETFIVADTPPHVAETVDVAVALNGVDFASFDLGVVFEFRAPATVTSTYPDAGSYLGGTRLHVYGTGFGTVDDGLTLCRFTMAMAAAGANIRDVTADPEPARPVEYVSTTEVVCLVPPLPRPGAVYVDVANNGQEFSSSGVIFTAQELLRVTTLHPRRGSNAGGTMVTLTGTNFVNREPLACRFIGRSEQPSPLDGSTQLDVIVQARWLSASRLECVSPKYWSSLPLGVTVDATNNGVDFTNDSVVFTYFPQPVIDSFYPTHGPPTGGTMVRIIGQNFGADLTRCRFGLFEAPALFISDTELVCSSPAHLVGDVPLEITTNGVDYTQDGFLFTYRPHVDVNLVAPFTGPLGGDTYVTLSLSASIVEGDAASLRCRFGQQTVDVVSITPATATEPAKVTCRVPPALRAVAATVLVDLTENGQDYTSSGIVYTYVTHAAVTRLTPHRGSVLGGQDVIVSGRNFTNHASTACAFGDPNAGGVVVEAVWHSSTEVRCVAPPGVPGKVVVEVTNNGQDFTYSGLYFEYLNDPVVHEVRPTHGPLTGHTAVTVIGDGFLAVDTLACRFGLVYVPVLEVLSSTAIVCVSPPSLGHAGAVAVEVTTNNATYSNYGVLFTYDQRVTVATLSPWAGPAAGGSVVVVYGSNFLDTDASVDSALQPVHPAELACRFDGVVVPARYLSPQQIVCAPAPAHRAGEVPFDVTVNGVDFTFSGAAFVYTDTPVVTSVSPRLGPALRASTLVTVRGAGFADVTSLVCKFGDVVVAATFRSEDVVLCRSPPAWPGNVTVQVSLNGLDWSVATTDSTFRYLEDESVLDVFPRRGLLLGQTSVYVLGVNFVNSSGLSCSFGPDAVVHGVYLNPSLVLCISPSRVAGFIDQTPVVAVEVANNGVDFSASGVKYTYTRACAPGFFCPYLQHIPCPNGTFCDGNDRFNFTLCAPGTFQPRAGQVACLTCPVGYQCPDFGMSKPEPCPAGFVCDTLGLRHAVTLCPRGHFCPLGTKSAFPDDFLDITKVDMDWSVGFPAVKPIDNEWDLDEEFGLLTFSDHVRNWTIVYRPWPETGTFRTENPPVGWREPTSPPWPVPEIPESTANFQRWMRVNAVSRSYELAHRPHPCPLGMYCRPGAAANVSLPRNFSTPQPCFEGFFCPRGSYSPEGRGACPTGFYCPSTTDAIPCPPGHYCPEVGNIKPLPCYPGTYNPLRQQGNCTLSPPGHTCPRWGMLQPVICRAGYVCNDYGLSSEVVLCPPGFYCPVGVVILETTRVNITIFVPGTAPGFSFDKYGNYNASLPNMGGRRYLATSAEIAAREDSNFQNQTDFDLHARREALRLEVLRGLVSGTDAPTYSIIADPTNKLVPRPCHPGTFCLGGVREPLGVTEWLPNNPDGQFSPQPCSEGTFCDYGTSAAAGTGACYQGHYCPPGTNQPVPAPLGTFSTSPGSVAPTLCFPGTYAPLLSTVKCRVCPAGYECVGYGTYEPTICPAGTYRSLADSITCRLCQQGTWSPTTGLASISDCLPCPSGRVCGIEAMTNLTQSVPCPAGHVCGEATTKAQQFNSPCPAGYYSFEESRPEQLFSNMCEKGHYCSRETKGFQKTRNKCPVGYFCPAGSADGFSDEVKCPSGTVTRSGADASTKCAIAPVKVCDKLNDDVNNPQSFPYVKLPLAEVVYYPKHRYTLNGASVFLDEPDREIRVLKRLNPVNETASMPYWLNDTLYFDGVCPNSMGHDALGNVTIYGRNFRPDVVVVCRFTYSTNRFRAFYSVNKMGAVLSTTRMVCPLPALPLVADYDSLETYTANIRIVNLGGKFTNTSLNLQLLPSFALDVNDTITNATRCHAQLQARETTGLTPLNRWFFIPALSYAKLSFDFEHLPKYFVYDEHFKIAVFVNQSICEEQRCDAGLVQRAYLRSPCTQPLQLSTWFSDAEVDKHRRINVTLYALEDVIFHVEMHIMYGLMLPFSNMLRNTTTVEMISPSRAQNLFGVGTRPVRTLGPEISTQSRRVVSEFTFVSLYLKSYLDTIAPTLNLPPRFQALERGRVLPGFNVSEELAEDEVKWVVEATDDVKPQPSYWDQPKLVTTLKAEVDKYREIFQEIDFGNGVGVYAFERMVLPYLPYFSNCKGYDSHIPFFALVEDAQCKHPTSKIAKKRRNYPVFPHMDDIKVVGPLDFFQDPIADVCERLLSCKYEENLEQVDVNPRWFEVADTTTVWSIIREPVDVAAFYSGGALIDEVSVRDGLDAFIPVIVDRTAAAKLRGECTTLCFPRVVTLELQYYQYTKNLKRLIRAKLRLQAFDRKKEAKDYVLHVKYYALNYLQLLIAFAFDQLTYVLIFIFVGAVTVLGTMVYWLIHRIITTLDPPPRFRFISFFMVVSPAPLLGYILSMGPILIIITAIRILIHGDMVLNGVTRENLGVKLWILDTVYGHFTDSVVDVTKIPAVRAGRIGLLFAVMALYLLVLGVRLFIPKEVSKKERELRLKGDAAALADSTWRPTLWKRANMLLVSLFYIFFLTCITEFAFWPGFGIYVWPILVLLYFVSIIVDLILDRILREALLMCPFQSAFSTVVGMVTLGSIDFAQFIISYGVDYAIMVMDRIYIGPGLSAAIGWFMDKMDALTSWVRKKLKMRRAMSLEAELAAEEDKKAKAKARDVEAVVEGGETVEPILDAFAGYTTDVMAGMYGPVVIYMLMIFRFEVVIPDTFGIREQDMFYYLLFAIITFGFQMVADVFLHNVQELFHGWKLYDYLVYTRYRFLQRETRWKGLEDSLDECIEEGMRTLDQMCFSSQYYLMLTVHCGGIVFFVLGLQMMIRYQFNPFGDPTLLLLVPGMLLFCSLFRRLLMFLARIGGVWRIKHANTAWHSSIGNEEDDEFMIPKWDELEKLKGASHEEFLMNQKITSETFRHRFLDYNRPWLVAQLPSVLTPRTLRRSRPFVLAQLSKLLGTVNPDISSDSSDDDNKKQFGPITLDSASRTMIRLWLAQARRRLRLREVVQPLITRARKQECEQCLSRRQLQVELMIPIDVMGDKFEAENPNMEEFDQVAWRAFWEKHQKYRTICMACITRRNQERREEAMMGFAPGALGGAADRPAGPDFGPVFLSPASKAIMRKWYMTARGRLRGRGGASPKRQTALAVSTDDEDEDVMAQAPWARKPVQMSAASRAIAVKWLQLARYERSKSGGGGVDPRSPTVAMLEAERIARVQAPAGSKSRFSRK